MRIKKGDTLIEVAIAIAVFSLVAIGVVSVVNGSTSAAQSSLEITVTREQIDAQAEALRFIHNSYIAGGQSNSASNEKYLHLWNAIKARAYNATNNDADLTPVISYNPTTCAELYDNNNSNNIYTQKAFVINSHYLGNPMPITSQAGASTYVNNVVVGANSSVPFAAAATYPRLLYINAGEGDTLLDSDANNTGKLKNYFSDKLSRVEGIYIIAIKDQNTTNVITGGGNSITRTSAFYDFYIRTCWFAPGADRPSTISTVIRLQDPEVINY